MTILIQLSRSFPLRNIYNLYLEHYHVFFFPKIPYLFKYLVSWLHLTILFSPHYLCFLHFNKSSGIYRWLCLHGFHSVCERAYHLMSS